MATPEISVAMGVYNAAPYLAAAIESVLSQTFADFEFLIVNDGSDDESGAILAHYADADPRIRVLDQPNRGLVASLNRIIGESRGQLIARMDADDLSMPNRFARQKAFLDSHPDYGVISSWAEDMNEDGSPRPLRRPDQPVDHAAFMAAIDAGRPLLCHPAAMIRRDVLVSVGGYRPAFRHCEDYDLWLRLASITRIGSLPERLVRYRYSETQVSTRHLVEQQIGAALTKLAYDARRLGEPDPTLGLTVVPPLESFDALFGRAGVTRAARKRIAESLLYSERALRHEGFAIILDHVRDGHQSRELWKTVARLVLLGELSRARQLAAALAAQAWQG